MKCQNKRANQKRDSDNAGFTLIELLVVISIIGILSAVVLSSLNTARARGREARRNGDLHSVMQSLELHNLTAGQYPVSPGADTNNCANRANCLGSLSSILTPQYIAQLPTDPSKDGTTYNYLYCAGNGNREYVLLRYSDTINGWCTPPQLPSQPTSAICWFTLVSGVPTPQYPWCK